MTQTFGFTPEDNPQLWDMLQPPEERKYRYLFTDQDIADELDLSPHTVRRLRNQDFQPDEDFIKDGREVFWTEQGHSRMRERYPFNGLLDDDDLFEED